MNNSLFQRSLKEAWCVKSDRGAVNAVELGKKLRYAEILSRLTPSHVSVSEKKSSNVPPHISYDSDRSAAQSAPELDYAGEEGASREAYEEYNPLREMGGRPSAPINPLYN